MITCDRSAPQQYEQDGQRFHSVSQVLEELYGDRFRFADPVKLAEARAKGMRRHLLFGCLVLHRAHLCEAPEIEERDSLVAKGLMGWIVEHEVEPIRVEESSVNLRHGYAGTPDLLCRMRRGNTRRMALVDLKTGEQEDAHSVQVQAYFKFAEYDEAQLLMDLYVNEEGNVLEKIVMPRPTDWVWFLSGLNVLKGRHVRHITREGDRTCH